MRMASFRDVPAAGFRCALTPRQREVLQLLAEGRPAKEVAFHPPRSSLETVAYHKYLAMAWRILVFIQRQSWLRFAELGNKSHEGARNGRFMKVLIVDDSEPMRRMIKTFIADLVGEIVECSDGIEALAAYRRTSARHRVDGSQDGRNGRTGRDEAR